MDLAELAGLDLGTRTHTITSDEAILYALAVGARADDIDLIYERGLRVLPTLACAIGLWAVESAGEVGAYDRTRSLHVSQRLDVREELRPGPVAMSGLVGAVYDKGTLTVVEVEVVCEHFEAGYTILLPGVGGWGGPPPPPSERRSEAESLWEVGVEVGSTAAALYRLTGDKHPVHIDAGTAEQMGLERPILHGLATLAMVGCATARAIGRHPAELCHADVRLSAPVYPGSELTVRGVDRGPGTHIEVEASGSTVLSGSLGFDADQPQRS